MSKLVASLTAMLAAATPVLPACAGDDQPDVTTDVVARDFVGEARSSFLSELSIETDVVEVDLLSEVAKAYGSWCLAEIQAGKSVADCLPHGCTIGSWAPAVAGALGGETAGHVGK